MATRPRTRKPLTKERVLAKAIELADAEGIEALSMRKLGEALGVEAMSLYNHVASKRDLVTAMVDRVVEQFELPEDGAWDDAIRRCAISAHALLIEHRWACRLALIPSNSTMLSGPRIRYMEWLLRRLREGGFSPEVAYSAYHTLDSHIFGFTLWQIAHADAANAFDVPEGENVEDWALRLIEQMSSTHPYLAEHGRQHMERGRDGDAEYAFGLELILDGLKKLRRKR